MPNGFDLPALIRALLHAWADDRHLFVMGKQFDATVWDCVPAGGLVLRTRARNLPQVDVIGERSVIEHIASASGIA